MLEHFRLFFVDSDASSSCLWQLLGDDFSLLHTADDEVDDDDEVGDVDDDEDDVDDDDDEDEDEDDGEDEAETDDKEAADCLLHCCDFCCCFFIQISASSFIMFIID